MLTRMISLLRPAPPAEPIGDADQVRSDYRRWRWRILYASLIGYALFYVVRKNLSVAMPEMVRDLGISKTDLGIFLTLHGLCYGVSKFANGLLGDRTNARYFMALGLVCTAAANVVFGLSSAVTVLGIVWLLNGWFQGMGFPPCARSLTHWFGPRERGTIFAIWNTSHSIGAALALVLCGFLVSGSWRLCFLVPAMLGAAGAVFLVNRLRDTPQSLGLPSIEDYLGEREVTHEDEGEGPADDFRRFVIRQVFLNRTVWIVSLANFFVYTVRYAVLDWGPTFLTETRGIRLQHASWTVAAYEVTGILGMLASGWMTDRVFKGRGGRACCFCMLMCGVCMYLFWRFPLNAAISTVLLCGVGFFIYGPQCLVGVIAANAATRRAAATAIGLTGLFGYLSGVLSGWGLGRIADTSGWDPVFQTLIAAAVVASALFALCWNAGQGLARNVSERCSDSRSG